VDSAFDGPGGVLANATSSAVTFDKAEVWELSTSSTPYRTQRPDTADAFWAASSRFKVLPVALHEIGHVLGLDHTSNPEDIMSPFYIAGQAQLSESDKQRVRTLLGSQTQKL
jgi:predicted Zn-dependent protease